MVIRTPALIESKPFPRKSSQIFGTLYAVPDDETRHFTAAHLGIDDNRLLLSAFPDLKVGCNDTYFFLYPLPVEQVFHLTAGKVHKYAALLLDINYKPL